MVRFASLARQTLVWFSVIGCWSILPGSLLANTEQSADPRLPAIVSPVMPASSHCPPYVDTPFQSASETLQADPTDWISKIVNAPPGAQVLLADGVYMLDRYAVVFEKPLTLRSASGNRDAVIIQGQGYEENAEALMIMADDVHIADLTVQNVRDHAISIKEGFARSVIYNVNLVDVGTQHIKGSRMGPDGVIACSAMGYTTEVGPGDYNGAIDLHAAVGWTIRDNMMYNIWGDGSGCLVDDECGTYYPGGGPALLLWKDSKDNIIERNRITGSFRGISLGLDTPYSGGVVRDNVVYVGVTGKQGIETFIEHDTGISLLGANDVIVEGNTVLMAGGYPGPIELQNVEGVLVSNNLVSAPVWNRGNSQYNSCDVRTGNDCDNPQFGNLIVAANSHGQSSRSESSLAAEPVTDEQEQGLPDEAGSSDEEETIGVVAESEAMTDEAAPDSAANREVVAATMDTSVPDLVPALQSVINDAKIERLRGTEERLKMKEERLLYMELMLSDRAMLQHSRLLQRQLDSSQLMNDVGLLQRLDQIEVLLKQLHTP